MMNYVVVYEKSKRPSRWKARNLIFLTRWQKADSSALRFSE
jgi:hypothetical protein